MTMCLDGHCIYALVLLVDAVHIVILHWDALNAVIVAHNSACRFALSDVRLPVFAYTALLCYNQYLGIFLLLHHLLLAQEAALSGASPEE
jgi:hypothetical protein